MFNFAYCKSASGILKALQVVLGIINTAILSAYVGEYSKVGGYLFLFCMVVGFLIGSFLLLIYNVLTHNAIPLYVSFNFPFVDISNISYL